MRCQETLHELTTIEHSLILTRTNKGERVNKTPVEFWVLIEDSLYSLNLDQKNYLKESDDEFAESRWAFITAAPQAS